MTSLLLLMQENAFIALHQITVHWGNAVYSKSTVIIGAITLVCLLIGAALAVLTLHLVFTTGLADRLEVHHLRELFARIGLSVALAGFAVAVYFTPGIPKQTDHGLNIYLMFGIFAAGVILAMLDPFNPIRDEYNFIRYPTAVVLVTAGTLLLHTAFVNPRHIVLKILAGALGGLLILAAGDEILQFHESVTIADETYLSEATGISSQDFTTLFVALIGIVVAVLARRLVRVFAQRSILGAGNREVAAADLFLAAGIAFLLAMLLDTFDDVLNTTGQNFLTFILPNSPLLATGELDSYFETLANSTEEFLEYTAAIMLLSTALVYRSKKA